MNYCFVITAKGSSERLPRKNVLPLGNKNLFAHSIVSAQSITPKIPIIVTSDDDEILGLSKSLGCISVKRPSEMSLPTSGSKETIEHALQETGMSDRHCILLQPTSPFRINNIIEKTLKLSLKNPEHTILTTGSIHGSFIEDSKMYTLGKRVSYWDGCIGIYPPGKICNYEKIKTFRNSYINSIQIDDELDYIDCCNICELVLPQPKDIFNDFEEQMVLSKLKNIGIYNSNVSLVARPSDKIVSQDKPVIYLNHARGYDGGRCDVLWIISNPQHKVEGISPETIECAKKAKLIILRNNGEASWLLRHIPEIAEKGVVLNFYPQSEDNLMTSGAMAAHLLKKAGCDIEYFGFSTPKTRSKDLIAYHQDRMSREISILDFSGAWDEIKVDN